MPKHIVVDRISGKVISEEEVPSDLDLNAFLRQQIHDCPDCRAAMERGEQPIFGGPEDIAEAMRAARRGFAKRPRWRSMKRRR